MRSKTKLGSLKTQYTLLTHMGTERRVARFRLHVGDCVKLMSEYPPNYFDTIVCDPPYDLTAGKKGGTGEASVNTETPYGRARITTGFMGQKWDGTGVAFRPETWAAAMRVLKPGGFLLAFGGSRTFHRMMVAIEDAGFEVRDMLAWIYGSGFPKSLDAGKAIDASLGLEREVTREATEETRPGEVIGFDQRASGALARRDEPVSEPAKLWDGWGTALKPAIEPICMARKPMIGTLAANLLTHGVGAINIDACRVGDTVETWPASRSYAPGQMQPGHEGETQATGDAPNGRWPANVLHDGSDVVVAGFPDAVSGQPRADRGTGGIWDAGNGVPCGPQYGDEGSAARFFYCAKASQQDRDEGLEDFEIVRRSDGRSTEHEVPNLRTSARRNFHPTVKPLELMRWLVRLVTPKDGHVLDPFMGSGSTGKACMFEGFRFTGMDLTPDYEPIARARIAWAIKERYRLDPFGFGLP